MFSLTFDNSTLLPLAPFNKSFHQLFKTNDIHTLVNNVNKNQKSFLYKDLLYNNNNDLISVDNVDKPVEYSIIRSFTCE